MSWGESISGKLFSCDKKDFLAELHARAKRARGQSPIAK